MKLLQFLLLILLSSCSSGSGNGADSALFSIDLNTTITKVRSAESAGERYVVATSYDGEVIGVEYDGDVLWRVMPHEGIMNHDLCCYDLDGDGRDEILAANADGSLYCIDSQGSVVWSFRPSSAPMYSVAVAKRDGQTIIACGGYDLNLYYLNSIGEELSSIHASTYTKEEQAGAHSPNFIRTTKDEKGDDIFVIHGTTHTMSSTASRGNIYWFRPLDRAPYQTHKIESLGAFGSMSFSYDNHIMMGTSKMLGDSGFVSIDQNGKDEFFTEVTPLLKGDIDSFGYRVLQVENIEDADGAQGYFILFGSRVILTDSDLSAKSAEVLTCRFSFNDLCKDEMSKKLIFASAQSGGSAIHIIDYTDPEWKAKYESLTPIGNITAIIEGTQTANEELDSFERPNYQQPSQRVYFMGGGNGVKDIAEDIQANYPSPVFLNGVWIDGAEKWDRSSIEVEHYRNRRDGRRDYSKSQDYILGQLLPALEKSENGISYWGGHGNDPYMVNPVVNRKVVDAAKGKKVVIAFPELEEHQPIFEYVLEDMLYPLAEYSRGKNVNIYIRSKNIFWHSVIYYPMWSRLLSGEFADIFIPAMEETTDKTMELSLAARLGVWSSGVADSWGSRCARDNASFDRLRQHSHQMLPNHFLRMMIYHTSLGTQFIENTWVDEQYMSIFSRMLAKELIFVPKREDIVSFSPVHISMLEPDEYYMNSGANVKSTVSYKAEIDEEERFSMGRLNGTYPGAPVTEWDISRYSAGVGDRRLNFLAPYNNGIVMLTPPQEGKFADKKAVRGKLVDHLHPIYRDIMKEYYTDGRYYYSADGKERYEPDTYYKTIEEEIKESAKLLPITLTGEVAWVAAQSAPRHLRLTMVDGGYLNPSQKDVVVSFNNIKVVKVTDLLTGEEMKLNGSQLPLKVDCGMFRFFDVEIAEDIR